METKTNKEGNAMQYQQDRTLERNSPKSERVYRNYIAGRWIDAADGRRLAIPDRGRPDARRVCPCRHSQQPGPIAPFAARRLRYTRRNL